MNCTLWSERKKEWKKKEIITVDLTISRIDQICCFLGCNTGKPSTYLNFKGNSLVPRDLHHPQRHVGLWAHRIANGKNLRASLNSDWSIGNREFPGRVFWNLYLALRRSLDLVKSLHNLTIKIKMWLLQAQMDGHCPQKLLELELIQKMAANKLWTLT